MFRLSLLVSILAIAASTARAGEPAEPFPLLLKHPKAIKASRAFNQLNPSQAAILARSALDSGELGKEEQAAVSFLHLLALTRSGQRTAALKAFNDLNEKQLPPGVASHVAWYHGQLLLENARPLKPDAERARELLARVPLSGRFGLSARRLLVRGLLLAGQTEDACRLSQETAERLTGKPAEPAARLQQAQCLERLAIGIGKENGWKAARPIREKAAGIYRLTARLWPVQPAGQAAGANLKRLVSQKVKPEPVDPASLLDRARRIVSRPRGRKDLKRMSRIRALAPRKATDPVRCEIDLLYAEVAVRFRWFKTAYQLLNGVKKRAADPELRARAGVDLAGLVARRRSGAALESYFEVAENWPETRAASWALYRAGELARRLQMNEVSRRAYLKCVESYPDTPAAARSRFALAWLLLWEGKHDEAVKWLDFLLASDEATGPRETLPDEPPDPCTEEGCEDQENGDEPSPGKEYEQESGAGEEQEVEEEEEETRDEDDPARPSRTDLEHRRFAERVRYWRARIREKQGNTDGAAADYQRLVREYPFDFYAVMARERLACLDTGWKGDPLPADDRNHLPSVEALHPEVAAAATYLQMNLPREARATLNLLPRESLARGDRRVAATLWLMMGEYSRSLWTSAVPWEGGLPDASHPETIVDARLAYPRAFYDIVKSPARDPGVPPALLFAIMRAESAFRPDARSPARALGLTQMVKRTALVTARRIKLKGFRFWSLLRPEISIRLGSAHMAELLAKFRGQPALMLAAYNAGEPAVYRWMSERGHLPIDAFIEEIPYSETNRYVRKVLSFYATYQALYESATEPLGIEFEIPDDLVARARKSNAVRVKAKKERLMKKEERKKEAQKQESPEVQTK